MIPDKLKKCIFDKWYKDFKNVEIIPYENCIWFIDRKNRYWYLEYQKTGHLWWRHQYFTDFFRLFSFERDKFEPIIKDWVEEVLNHKVLSTYMKSSTHENRLENVLNCKILEISVAEYNPHLVMDEILDSKSI